MPRSDVTADPPRRTCAVCGGALRRSHLAYLGGNQQAAVYRCEACGATGQGPAQARGERGRSEPVRAERRRRALPDGGSPDNPVIDGDMARLLRERFGGTGEGG